MVENRLRKVSTAYGEILALEGDAPVSESLIKYGEWAGAEIDFLRSLVKRGDCVVDVGAYLGTHSLALSCKIEETGRIFSIEPNPTSFKILLQNIELAHFDNFVPINIFVEDRAGQVSFAPSFGDARFNLGAAIPDKNGQAKGGRVVQSQTLDSLDLQCVRLIKIDAEGGGIRVLEGAKSTIKKSESLVYIECNTIQEALDYWQFGISNGLIVHYCEFPIFRENNYRNDFENLYGEACESAILLSHRSSHLEDCGAFEVQSEAHLKRLFFHTPRWLDTRVGPTALELKEKQREFSCNIKVEPKITKPVVVVVPVYNRADILLRLVDSLEKTYAAPTENLQFLIYDDCSSEGALHDLYSSHLFFKRSDVRIVFAKENLGFVGAVNAAIGLSQHDVVLLNSDTEVWTDVIGVLQDAAYSSKTIASVCPYSNDATILSLFSNPFGRPLPNFLEPEFVSKVIGSRRPIEDSLKIPSGVGFCMFIKRMAWQCVGEFSTEFSPGYGEENDWCQRALKLGWTHALCTRAFVFHNSGSSFGNQAKRALIEKHYLKLLRKHPRYQISIEQFHESDLARIERLDALLAIVDASRFGLTQLGIAYLLHSNPDIYFGGTEKHVQRKRNRVNHRGLMAVELFPESDFTFRLRVWFRQEKLFDDAFDRRNLSSVFEVLARSTQDLEVHHLLGWSDADIDSILKSSFVRKKIWAHDFYMMSPSIQLLSGGLRLKFCGVDSDLRRCELCAKKFYGLKSKMRDYRIKYLNLMNRFNEVVFPSSSTRDLFERALQIVGLNAAANWITRTHNLSYCLNLAGKTKKDDSVSKGTLVFLGAFGPHKGLLLLVQTAFWSLLNRYKVHIVGRTRLSGLLRLLGVAEIHTYKNEYELHSCLQKIRPEIIALPAIWPETFSYAFYEAVILSQLKTAIIVGPFGHPAEAAKKFKAAVVLRGTKFKDFILAIQECASASTELSKGKSDFVRSLSNENQEIRMEAQVGRPGHPVSPIEFFNRRNPFRFSLRKSLKSIPVVVSTYARLKLVEIHLKKILERDY